MMPMVSHGVSARGLFFREAGPNGATSPAIVLLHGWSCHAGFFEPQLQALSGKAQVLVPDLPGHGQTGDAAGLTIEAAADAVIELLQDRDLSNVVLVGWSMGAHVAYALAERHGTSRLKALVALDMTPKVVNDATWRGGVRDGLDILHNAEVLEAIIPRWPQMAERIAARIFATGRKPDPQTLAYARREVLAADPALLKPMWASLTAQDFRAFLPRLDCPLHLVCGGQSALYDASVADWHSDNVPGVSVHGFGSSGHAPHLEEPERLNRLLLGLIAL
ncbi:alpha/beta fold hydrolase [Pannonibacter carbonis]|uniref:alpha/beta fold hydrolase n=1 Tax=Pannonibacter carbonis TaxID=2067569 RepID=UPI001AD9145B|nr:alpha/beta hydrolase [Pannonibacter carbonis]